MSSQREENFNRRYTIAFLLLLFPLFFFFFLPDYPLPYHIMSDLSKYLFRCGERSLTFWRPQSGNLSQPYIPTSYLKVLQ